MHSTLLTWLRTASLAVVAFIAQGITAQETIRAGAAQVVITPESGAPLAGYYSFRTADGVLDDIYAKALVLESGGTKVALVTLDLISFPRAVALAARTAVEKETGIPTTHVMISATHQHTGPVLSRESTRDDLDGGGSSPAKTYTEGLPALVARSVREAADRLTPARLKATRTQVENLAYNRRFWMADGTVGWNPPKLSPDIVAPAGPHDPEVGIMVLETLDKTPRPLACYVNYAMHPDTTGGMKISADYPGWLARTIAQVHGPEMVTLFANGCCGNLNHRNVWWADRQQGPAESARLGSILAGAVCAAWPSLHEIAASPLRSRSELVHLPLPIITEVDRAEARDELRRTREKQGKFMAQVKAFRVLDVEERAGRPWELEVQVIALGDDIAVVSLPGEIFVELGLTIKAASPFRHTFIAELANGSIGYIPNRSAYAEGNYEVVSSRAAEGSGEMLVDAAVRLLNELKPSR
jgi:neutral ceramidase